MSKFHFESSILCRSHLGRDVEILQRLPLPSHGVNPVKVLLIAAMHGDEPEGVHLMNHFFAQRAFDRVSPNVDLYVVPQLNPDGVAAGTRVNGHRVDLNRNFPNADWTAVARADRYNPGSHGGSEPETQGLTQWLHRHKPHFIVNFHSWNPMVNYDGDCEDLAQLMSDLNGCPVTADMGYPTPGSSGVWFWEALRIPSITLEIQEGASQSAIEQSGHLAALVAVINAAAIKYIDSGARFC